MSPFHSCAFLFLLLVLSFSTYTSARLIEHTFNVEGVPLRRLCKEIVVTTVNGSVPGPTIYAREGDSLVVHVLNNSPYNITIHWHGVIQYQSCWADGTSMITQCPIYPQNRFTYRFKISNQEGTFWWHAHAGYQRITVYGAIIIYPKIGRSYPFPEPYKDVPIILGEWYDQNIVEIDEQLLYTGSGPNTSDSFTLNGWSGDLYPCSSNRRRFLKRRQQYSNIKLPFNDTNHELDTYKLNVIHGKTYLLRIISAALSRNLFFKIANHKMEVVAVDGSYTKPYHTDVLAIAPGQTIDVLMIADQPPSQYYMASLIYRTSKKNVINTIPATGVIFYEDAIPSLPKMPTSPDRMGVEVATQVAFEFLSKLTGLTTGPFWEPVPREADEYMFINIGFGLFPCLDHNPARCHAPFNTRLGASLNNISFASPTNLSILQAFFDKVDGIYTTDFPDEPPVKFDYVNERYSYDWNLIWTERFTKVKQFKFNTIVDIVFQGNSFIAPENHPMHIHGHNFYVLGQGFGNYDPIKDRAQLNFVNPHTRHTIMVPVGGWMYVRFRANNPGVWYVHCHNEAHVPIGLATAFIVQDGPTLSTMLPPPPLDLPHCYLS